MIEYPSGAPFYLSYGLDSERLNKYKETFGMTRIEKNYIINDNDILIHGTIQSSSEEPYIDHGYFEYDKAIAIMSDGALSFTEASEDLTSKTRVPISFDRIIKEVMAFKSFSGEFVHRRMQRFNKDCQQKSWQHYDDFSMAVISNAT